MKILRQIWERYHEIVKGLDKKREERLAFSKDSGITISCEKCGKPILTGRFCKECKNSMRDDLSKMYGTENKVAKQKKTGDPNGKMRFLKN